MQELIDLPWAIILTVAGTLIAVIGAILLFKENKDWGLICAIVGFFITGISTVIQYNDRAKASKEDKAFKNFVQGTSEVPALTGSVLPVFDSMGKQYFIIDILLTNPDYVYSLKDVRVKFMEGEMKNVGNLNPRSYTEVFQLSIPKRDTEYCYIVIWYSTGKIEVDFTITKDKFGNAFVATQYLDDKRKEFEPAWKKRAREHDPKKDTAVPHYDPTLYQPIK